MKKITVALLITGSTLFASQNAQVLTNEDSQFIFGNQQANVQLLDQNEMSETKARGWISSNWKKLVTSVKNDPWKAMIQVTAAGAYMYTGGVVSPTLTGFNIAIPLSAL